MKVPFKQQVFSSIKTFWTPPPSIYRFLYFKGRFRVHVGDKFFYINHYGYDIETSIFWMGLTGGWEKVSLSIWIKLCRRSRIIIDVGANTGVYSLAAKAVSPDSKVFSFEPVKRVYDKLVANRDLNTYDMACCQTAISDYDGEGVVYDLPTEHIYSVTLNKNLHGNHLPVEKVSVAVHRLSTFIETEKLSTVDLIKIDVESHEPEVLKGMGPYLPLMKPTMLIEVWNDEIGARVESLLRGNDYLFFSTDETQPFKRTDHIRNATPSRGYLSYLICTPQVASELKFDH
jgi:FkbM family methyltransferase